MKSEVICPYKTINNLINASQAAHNASSNPNEPAITDILFLVISKGIIDSVMPNGKSRTNLFNETKVDGALYDELLIDCIKSAANEIIINYNNTDWSNDKIKLLGLIFSYANQLNNNSIIKLNLNDYLISNYCVRGVESFNHQISLFKRV
ncbi:MAG: hypothetical protein WC307_05675 [Candidatus Nanoarchaeia archaeon]|jgi:hypothetical protein